MTLKSASTLILLLLSGETIAKQWMILPMGMASQKKGMSAMAAPQGMTLTGGISRLGVYKTQDSEIKPQAPAGFRTEELKPVKVLTNDPLFAQQWNLARVMAPRGWARMTATGPGVLVAVVDTGIDPTHPDLAGKVVGGGNFVSAAPVLPSGSWKDDHSHGTFCASLIAAQRDNGTGMAGLGNAQLLAVKVLDKSGYGTDYGVAQGMVWAVDQGAKILSISLGTSADSAVLEYAVQYAKDHGVLVVAASGNGGVSEMVYPAAIPGVLAVGASTKNDTRAPYSTYNSQLSMVAPGGDDAAQIVGAVPGGGYSQGVGTSFACPQVAGAAALYLAQNPKASAEMAFAALTATADPIDMAAGKSATTGWGRLNLARLLGEDVEPNVFAVQKQALALTALGGAVAVLVGAGEPLAPAVDNPDPSHVAKVWAVLSQGGIEVVRQELASLGGNDWTAQVVLPYWPGSSSRTLALGYQAVDSSGHATPMADGGSVVQAAGSKLPSLSHTPPASADAGKPLTLIVSESGGSAPLSNWTLHILLNGAWVAIAGDASVPGSVAFNVSASGVNGDRLEYYFSAVDAGGSVVFMRHDTDPYLVAVYSVHEPLALKYLANPAPEICVRLVAGSAGIATVDFYSIDGEKVGSIRQQVQEGENRLCLGSIVASGVYFGRARMEGQRGMTQIKLAIKR
jgi:subtilisin family serine protease